ncbi:MAG: ATP-dependent DNA helicase [Nanoarchaeota archaeon]|nr:ATP-dependent DNA helicase [Nanoarchaeota archaeon]
MEQNGQDETIRKAVGPCVILAGAGTGKTYSIVEKIKYLIKEGIYKPERIVCITFSNEAANNLISRIRRNFDLNYGEPVIRTFHGFSADLLREYGDRIGINRNFGILTPDEAKVVLFRFLKVPVGNCHGYIQSLGSAKDLGIRSEDVKNYLIEKMKNFEGVDLQKRLESLQFEMQTLYLRKDHIRKKEIAKEIKNITSLLKLGKFLNVWNAYEKLKSIKNYQDYSDLNRNALALLHNNKQIAKNYDYIIVDEFQDTNKVQLDFLKELAEHRNITIVGDLNQSIYRFRGAYNKNFQEFKEIFKVQKEDIFNLDKSFRSSNKILRTAHKLIMNNYENKEECFEVFNAKNREGEKIEVYELKDSKEEARKVVEIVEREINNGCDFKDICVMFRTHQQGRIIKKALELKKIPYVSVSKSSLLKERSIKTVIDYLTILNKLKNKEKGGEQAWWDLIYQSDFVETDLIKIGKFIKDNLESDNLCGIMLNNLVDIDLTDAGKLAVRILIKRIKLMLDALNKEVSELVKEIYNIGGLLNDQKKIEEKAIIMNFNRFYDLVKEHGGLYGDDLANFLYYLDILNSLGIEIESADSENDGVRLMTLHATKGLEYKNVIITNLAQKRFPIDRIHTNLLIPIELYPEFSGLNEKGLSEEEKEYYIYQYEKKNQLFEERRLCYVAFTRAKEKLVLTGAGEYGGKNCFPSQFLEEIEFRKNEDLTFYQDLEEKYAEPEIELKRESNFFSLFKGENIDESTLQMLRGGGIKKEIFSPKNLVLSPSSLLLFKNCQKKFEYKYIYNMPEQKTISWEAILLGSFVHIILEKGVKANFKDFKNFEAAAREMQLEEEWQGVDLNDAILLIKVFFERNKMKYNSSSKTEQKLNILLGGVKFTGFADRIDFCHDGLEIVDYKTGKSAISPLARNWQLGYYALAASSFGSVRRITLDMLRHDTPLEFELDTKGNAKPINSSRMEGFNIYDVEKDLIDTAQEIINAYEKGFNSCSIEKNCEFCNEYVWGL